MFTRFSSSSILCPECFRMCELGKWLLERLPKRLSRAVRERSLRHEKRSGGVKERRGRHVEAFTGRFLFLKSSFNVLNLGVQIGRLASPKLQSGVLNELSGSAA